MPPETAPPRTIHWLWPPLLLLGCITAVIAWLLLSLSTGRQCGWMALLAALDVVLMLRFGTLRAGGFRATVATIATALVIVITNWSIVSAQIGIPMGLDPVSSATRMGPHLALTLAQLANRPIDLLCIPLALLLAGWLSR